MIKITLPNQGVIEFDQPITGVELIKKANISSDKIMVIGVNNQIKELGDVISSDAVITYYDVASQVGNKIYIKGLSYIFALAIKEIFDHKLNYRIQTSVNNGLYIWFEEQIINDQVIEQLLSKMREISQANHIYKSVTVNRFEAMDYFRKVNRPEKVRLLRYNTKSFISLYKLNDQYDYYYGKMPYSTGFVNEFDLKKVDEKGLLLRFPTVFHGGKMPEFIDQTKLFGAYRAFADWCSNQGVIYTSDLNEYITFKDINELIRIEEGRHNNDLFDVCKQIKNNPTQIKTILIAGPTSSGKTTTSKKLATYLKGMGYKVKTLSVDDYFKERIDTPKDAAGEFDYDSLAAIDVELFNNHLMSLFNGSQVLLPKYNFLTGEKEYTDKKFKLEPNTILIVEGLHALNESLSSSIVKEEKFKIYISPLAQLNLDKNNPISSSDIRLLRRMVRDHKYRGNSVADTINIWPKVRAAEDKFIYKYQAEADAILNTSLMYEIGALKTWAEAYLYEVTEEQKEYEQVKMLLNFLRNFLPIPTEEIPRDSLLREFIGGSCYE